MTDAQLIINLVVCGSVIVVSVLLLLLIKKNPKKDEKALARKECLRGAGELARLGRDIAGGGIAAEGKRSFSKVNRSLNYARRLAQQIAYEDENSASESVLENVQEAKNICAAARHTASPGERAQQIAEAERYLNRAVQLLNDIEESAKVIRKKR